MICSEMEWANIIAQTSGKNTPDLITQGTLSIKCVYGGEETYIVGREKHHLKDGRFLIMNCGEEYRSKTETAGNVESFCLFFHPKFVSEGLRAQISQADHLLDNPFSEFDQPLHFLNLVQGSDSPLSSQINRIRKRLQREGRDRVSGETLHEEFHLLLESLLNSHRDTLNKIKQLETVRIGTRLELYRRIERGREFIEDNLSSQLKLSDIAMAAYLSPHYLLRLFRQIYKETPHQYLTRRRLERACELLATTSDSITAICFDVGFESPSTFSLLFRKHRGVSPRAYRHSLQQS